MFKHLFALTGLFATLVTFPAFAEDTLAEYLAITGLVCDTPEAAVLLSSQKDPLPNDCRKAINIIIRHSDTRQDSEEVVSMMAFQPVRVTVEGQPDIVDYVPRRLYTASNEDVEILELGPDALPPGMLAPDL